MRSNWTQFAISAAAVGALLYVPGLARANGLRVSSYEMNDTGGTVQLESNAPIGEPWVRFDARSVKIWFPDVTEIARFDHARDAGEAIRTLQLRPGASASAVLHVELGTGRTLSQENVQVTRNGTLATIKVRAPLPAAAAPERAPAAATMAASAAAPVPKSPTPTAAAVKPAAPVVSSAATPPSAQAADVTAPAAKPLQLAAASADEQAVAREPSGLATGQRPTAKGGADAKDIGFATAPGSNLGILIAISVVLLGVYAALRAYGKKRVQFAPDIQVVSSRRVGHRQELMVVRALGADHLLVCSPGKIERVTSVPTPVLPALAPAPSAAPAATPLEASQAGGLGIISKLSSRSRLRRLLDAVEQEGAAAPEGEPAPEPPSRPSARPSFGPELLSAIHSHKLTSLSALPQIAPLGGRESEAVAGIQRLRGRGAN
jgi:hypothetical protein